MARLHRSPADSARTENALPLYKVRLLAAVAAALRLALVYSCPLTSTDHQLLLCCQTLVS
eukprot:scaffold62716_cov36-Tisochrysis_lutea.AAC.3